MSDAGSDAGRADRQAVLKTAKLLFGDSAVDCLVVNVSETGFRVELSGMIPIPERITVQFSGGALFQATQRWARGLEIGFVIEGPARLGAADRAAAWGVYEAMRDRGLDGPITRLRALRCFDDPELARLTADASVAIEALEAALRLRAQGG